MSYLVKLKAGLAKLYRSLFKKSLDFTSVRYASSFHSAGRIGKKEVVFIGEVKQAKWALVKCPCGCGEVIHIDLMISHLPSWKVKFESNGTVSFYPSLFLDDSKCGSHFWIRKNKIVWHR